MAECKHGLDTQWCASCKDPLRTTERDHEVGPPFPARYDGWCPDCHDRIDIGDHIRMCDGRAFHTECVA